MVAAPDLDDALDELAQSLGTDCPSICVAVSGGIDSMLLLHLLVEARARRTYKLSALHVHHGLSPNADAWSAHCEEVCRRQGIPMEVFRVQVTHGPGQSLEEEARRARHEVFSRSATDVIALAHHADDQAETVLLQLLRGAGPKGLSAMPVLGAPFGKTTGPRPWRPLLSLTRAQVREFADVRAIVWVDDESNLDSQLRRNALRNVVMPAMARHFPGVPNTLSRAARLQAQAVRLLDEIADEDLCHIEIGDALDCNALICLSLSRQANAVRRWIARRGVRAASEARLRALLRAVGESSNDSRLLWRHENLRVVRRKALLMADVVDE